MATIRIHDFPAHYQSGIKKLDYLPGSVGPGNRLKTSQRQASDTVRSDDTFHAVEPVASFLVDQTNIPKITTNRTRSGRRFSEDATPIQVLSPCVKATLHAVNATKVIELTYRLAHEEMGPKRRKSVEHNLATFKARCDRYGRLTTDRLEALREPFKAE